MSEDKSVFTDRQSKMGHIGPSTLFKGKLMYQSIEKIN